jgi:truncated hemoglobin YjbI
VSKTEIGKAQFEHWLKLFRESVDSLFSGENARPIKMVCQRHGKRDSRQDERSSRSPL